MPFYEYECPKCGYHDEVLQMLGEKPLTKCPSCGKSGLKKLVSAPVFRLKGSGWYETDFKSDKENKRNLAGADKEEPKEAKANSKDDGKAETKAEAKADAKPDAKAAADKPAKAEPKAAGTARRARSTPKPKPKPARKTRR